MIIIFYMSRRSVWDSNLRMTDEVVDVYTYDSYPNFAYCLGENPKTSKNLNGRRWSDELTAVAELLEYPPLIYLHPMILSKRKGLF